MSNGRIKTDKIALEFTPLEFETRDCEKKLKQCLGLEFTPLEFETSSIRQGTIAERRLEFTPLEFETTGLYPSILCFRIIRIYSVGV